MKNKDNHNNMAIWDSLCETNPEFTKQFRTSWGKNATTTDPMYQIQKMTNQFGAIGRGWKFESKYHYTESIVFAEVKIFWREKDQPEWNEYGAISSMQPLYKKNGSLDDEAAKKAMTDALTKGFSYLGVSADVFLGRFDDSKYVDKLKEKFTKQDLKVVSSKPTYNVPYPINASNVEEICNGNRKKAFRRVLGVDSLFTETNEAMMYGIENEHKGVEFFNNLKTSFTVTATGDKQKTIYHKDFSDFCVTPDGIIESSNDKPPKEEDNLKRYLEIKCPFNKQYETVPQRYISQTQLGLEILSYDQAILLAYFEGNTRMWRIWRSRDYFNKYLLPRIHEFKTYLDKFTSNSNHVGNLQRAFIDNDKDKVEEILEGFYPTAWSRKKEDAGTPRAKVKVYPEVQIEEITITKRGDT